MGDFIHREIRGHPQLTMNILGQEFQGFNLKNLHLSNSPIFGEYYTARLSSIGARGYALIRVCVSGCRTVSSARMLQMNTDKDCDMWDELTCVTRTEGRFSCRNRLFLG